MARSRTFLRLAMAAQLAASVLAFMPAVTPVLRSNLNRSPMLYSGTKDRNLGLSGIILVRMLSSLATGMRGWGLPKLLVAVPLTAAFFVTRAAAQGAGSVSAPGGSFLGLALQNFTPYHALAGGLLLGMATAMSMIIKGEVLGVSGIVGGIVKGKHKEMHRWFFLAGLFSGAAALTAVFPSALGKPQADLWRAALGGLLVGMGATWGNGCTSGHGIAGNSRLAPRSMAYTLVFMGSGFLTASLLQTGSAVSFATSLTPSTVRHFVCVCLCTVI